MTVRRLLSPFLLLCLGAALPVGAQSVPRPIKDVKAAEAFVHLGRFDAGSDEGSIATGISYGGTLTVPLARGIALDLDVQTSDMFKPMGANHSYQTRRTLVLPSVIYRFGRERAYGYGGGGIGAEFDSSTYRQEVGSGGISTQMGWQEVSPGVFELNRTETSPSVSFRGGFAAFPIRRVGVRGDVFIASWHLGARIGVGYRFSGAD